MSALLSGVALICLLQFETPCSGQTAPSPSKAINTQSVAVRAPSIGDSCDFRQVNEVDSHPNCVLQNGEGKLFIAQGYVKKLEFDSHGMAVVFDESYSRQGWMYVDRKGRVVIKAVPDADNWAEEFSDGLVRTVVNNKYGFADRHGKMVIPAKYDGAFPFMQGHAVVCIGCRETCAMPDRSRADSNVDCEHHIVTGGEWFKINKTDRVVARVSH